MKWRGGPSHRCEGAAGRPPRLLGRQGRRRPSDEHLCQRVAVVVGKVCSKDRGRGADVTPWSVRALGRVLVRPCGPSPRRRRAADLVDRLSGCGGSAGERRGLRIVAVPQGCLRRKHSQGYALSSLISFSTCSAVRRLRSSCARASSSSTELTMSGVGCFSTAASVLEGRPPARGDTGFSVFFVLSRFLAARCSNALSAALCCCCSGSCPTDRATSRGMAFSETACLSSGVRLSRASLCVTHPLDLPSDRATARWEPCTSTRRCKARASSRGSRSSCCTAAVKRLTARLALADDMVGYGV